MQHFMTRYLTTIVILFQSFLFAQIKVSGIVSDQIGPLPGINVKTSDSISSLTDFDGKYELSISESKKIDILFDSYSDLVTIEITHIDIKKLNGLALNVIIPSRDRISAKDYEKLTENEKQKYNPLRIVTFGSSRDTYASKEFKQKFVIIYLGNRKIKITDFKYDTEKERVVIDGNEL
jgi:hypothetical protein